MRDVPLQMVDSKEQLSDIMQEADIDFFIMFSFGIILPNTLTSAVEIYNIHTGDLPWYKGRHPTYWATVGNEKQIGITLHVVAEGIDSGDIIARKLIPYYFWMTEDDLSHDLLKEIPCLLEALFQYKQGKLNLIPNIGGTYYKTVEEQEKTILSGDSWATIFNKIRAQTKYEGAKFILDESLSVWIKNARFVYGTDKGDCSYYESGDFLYVHVRDGIWIKTKSYKFVGSDTV